MAKLNFTVQEETEELLSKHDFSMGIKEVQPVARWIRYRAAHYIIVTYLMSKDSMNRSRNYITADRMLVLPMANPSSNTGTHKLF